MGVALARHEEIVKEILEAHNDYVFKTVEKALCCAFAAATEVLEVALPQEQAEEARKTPAGPRWCGEGVASAGVISQRDEVGQKQRLHLFRFFGVQSSTRK